MLYHLKTFEKIWKHQSSCISPKCISAEFQVSTSYTREDQFWTDAQNYFNNTRELNSLRSHCWDYYSFYKNVFEKHFLHVFPKRAKNSLLNDWYLISIFSSLTKLCVKCLQKRFWVFLWNSPLNYLSNEVLLTFWTLFYREL